MAAPATPRALLDLTAENLTEPDGPTRKQQVVELFLDVKPDALGEPAALAGRHRAL